MLPGQSGKIVATFISSRTSGRRGQRRMNVERPHRDVDGEQLQEPACRTGAGSRRAAGSGERSTASPAGPCHEQRRTCPTSSGIGCCRAWAITSASGEEEDPDRRHDHEARHRPARDLGGQQDVADEEQRREEVEEAVGEDGADERTGRALPALDVAAEDGDAGQLADPAR